MKAAEAENLAALLHAAFASLEPDTLDLFKDKLAPLDADVCSAAILKGIDYWTRPPRWADVREAIRIETDQRALAQPRPVEPASDGPLPFWVRRHVCARFLYPRFSREQDLRPFPQQFPAGAPPHIDLMPDDEWAEEANTVDIQDAWKAIRANTGGAA